ncbi:hypothetical protein [Paenibacillus sp. NFR01]|uniref:hypothetical protein n=1 Tax=Paenibacillus sp. NFR01 TaxID=1566279 RepID=UPI0008ABFF16|nr:hypothetical protein [Paenibacillus sp. NFR01]SET87136.1 hypothetical protein SAMN03159358_2509 [Paenibacillus sp. NFR01]
MGERIWRFRAPGENGGREEIVVDAREITSVYDLLAKLRGPLPQTCTHQPEGEHKTSLEIRTTLYTG